ncbi:hypothetical protein GBAR_LOCUS4518 [Geodia barretti]|uniref:Uncharacterized protein n=1 Tax=Geodia barretti TaxID=519541 RepID=A0AA35R7I9_GEOBA|nr:hypothetical protein GBAR_LOCUS4518 [Geodia barretti]
MGGKRALRTKPLFKRRFLWSSLVYTLQKYSVKYYSFNVCLMKEQRYSCQHSNTIVEPHPMVLDEEAVVLRESSGQLSQP